MTTLPHKVKDIKGQRFGSLVALEFSKLHKAHAYWVCECDCGELSVVRGTNLRNGNTGSCGCGADKNRFKPSDISGMRFGRLAAIKSIGLRKDN